PDNTRARPVMIHRAPFGSLERFVAVLIEHTAGNFPLWLSPEQFTVLPISDKFADYAYEVKTKLEAADLRGTVDARDERIGRKIRDAELAKTPYLLVVGEKEAQDGLEDFRHSYPKSSVRAPPAGGGAVQNQSENYRPRGSSRR
nr:threonine--tRNA ligase, mitochondrial 1-like [Tanacetum cinerariifolium]